MHLGHPDLNSMLTILPQKSLNSVDFDLIGTKSALGGTQESAKIGNTASPAVCGCES